MTIVLLVFAIYAAAWCALAFSDRRGWNGVVDDAGALGASATDVEQRQAA